jgi:transaldolase
MTRNERVGEGLFFELALEDLTQAADLFRPIHDRTCGVDGWVSSEVSPLLAHDTKTTLAEAKDLHARAARPNLFIKIPGTKEGVPAIEEATFAGVPINVILLFSREQYVAAAEAYLHGVERRIDAGLEHGVESVASLFISRWDVAVIGKVPEACRSWRTWCGDTGRWGKLRKSFGPICRGQSRLRRSGHQTPGRRRHFVLSNPGAN